jgi:hypothetical protein
MSSQERQVRLELWQELSLTGGKKVRATVQTAFLAG